MSKVNHWNYIRTKLKTQFESMGITYCEKCGTRNGLTFAHRLKRRFITDDTELMTVALLCLRCHQEVEQLPHQQMFEQITEVIENRL